MQAALTPGIRGQGIQSSDTHPAEVLLPSLQVQGVFFRACTAEEAQRLGTVGWVRNTPAGSVEGEAQGSQSQLNSFKVLQLSCMRLDGRACPLFHGHLWHSREACSTGMQMRQAFAPGCCTWPSPNEVMACRACRTGCSTRDRPPHASTAVTSLLRRTALKSRPSAALRSGDDCDGASWQCKV